MDSPYRAEKFEAREMPDCEACGRLFVQERCDPFFNALGDLLKTGPTGTNVNDLLFLFAF